MNATSTPVSNQPIVATSVVATVVSRYALGNHPAFPVPPYELVSPFELAPYMATGFIAGFVALAFMRERLGITR